MRPFLLLLGATIASAAPPNVLFIAVDDLRPQLGCYGESYMVTPHIDTLASQGRMFRNHYVAVPTCGASRYALMSGLRPTAASDDNGAFMRLFRYISAGNEENQKISMTTPVFTEIEDDSLSHRSHPRP